MYHQKTATSNDKVERRMIAMNIETHLRHSLWWYDEADRLLADVKSGNPGAVELAVVTLPSRQRGLFVRWCVELQLNQECLRIALSRVWQHDHLEIRRACPSLRKLNQWWRRATFDVSMLPDPITIWRGTSGLDFFDAVFGLSWSTDRAIACWFAMKNVERFKKPLVLKRTVRRRDVLFYTNERSEQEAVVIEVSPATTDGDPSDWQRAADEVSLRWANDTKKFLDSVKAATGMQVPSSSQG